MNRLVPLVVALILLTTPASAALEDGNAEFSLQSGYTLIVPMADGGFMLGGSILVPSSNPPYYFGMSAHLIGTLTNQRYWSRHYDPAIGFSARVCFGRLLETSGYGRSLAVEWGYSAGALNLGSKERESTPFSMFDLSLRARRGHMEMGVGALLGVRMEDNTELATGMRFTVGYIF